MLTQSEALGIVDLTAIKAELRIPGFTIPADPTAAAAAKAAEKEHDDLLSGQIHDAANFVSETTGLGLDDLAPLRAAIVSAVRDMYNGVQQIGPNAAAYGWMTPYRSFKPPE